MYKSTRNQSQQTLPKKPAFLSLLIHYNQREVLKIAVKTTDTVRDLLGQIRKRLDQFENIIGLCTMERLYTLDYALMNHDTKLAGIRNYQKLQLVLEDIVSDLSTPTLADFRFLALLGEGISAAVYLVRHCSNGRLYALKQIKKQYFREFKTLESVLRERKILAEMVKDITFATKLVAAFQSQRQLNFLLEFYPGGQFFYHLTKIKLDQQQARICFAEILLGMQQLHKKKILYRDLKPENIMIDFQGHLRIGDFGLCRINLQPQDHALTQCGSPQYMAYEVKQNGGYSYQADFYTMGAIIYQMVKSVPPFYHNKQQPPQFRNTTQGFRQLVLALIQKDTNKRLANFNHLRQSKWLRDINWQMVKKKRYQMPIRLNYYQNYIHPQFVSKEVSDEELRYEERYDRLFNMFFYLAEGKEGIMEFYPHAANQFKHHKSPKMAKNNFKNTHKDHDNMSNRSNDNASHRSKSGSVRSQKSSTSKTKRDINQFKRNPIHQINIYTSANYAANRLKKTDTSHKSVSVSKGNSVSKGKKNATIMQNKNAIKFNKMTSVKSGGKLKAVEYIRQLDKKDRNHSKKKQKYLQ